MHDRIYSTIHLYFQKSGGSVMKEIVKMSKNNLWNKLLKSCWFISFSWFLYVWVSISFPHLYKSAETCLFYFLSWLYHNSDPLTLIRTSITPSCSGTIPAQKSRGNSVLAVIFSHTMPKMDFHYSHRFSWEKTH